MSVHDLPDDEDYLGWRRNAECLGVDPELFFPNKGDNPQEALAYCRRCPVRQFCAEEHLFEQSGVFGGLTSKQRARIRVSRGLTVAPPPKRPKPGRPACGTTAGYHRHKRDGEPCCRPCLDARADYRRAKKAAAEAAA